MLALVLSELIKVFSKFVQHPVELFDVVLDRLLATLKPCQALVCFTLATFKVLLTNFKPCLACLKVLLTFFESSLTLLKVLLTLLQSCLSNFESVKALVSLLLVRLKLIHASTKFIKASANRKSKLLD